MLVTLTALGLGTANPAFASGGETPDPAATPVTPVIAVPEPEIAVPDVTSDLDSATSAELDLPQIETSIQTDGVNTNVDVRVLSPGTGGAVTQADAAPEVISPGVDPDITSSRNPASRDESATPTATRETVGDPTDVAGSQGANTNVSVRVLSPGDDGPVSQVAGPGEASSSATIDPRLPSSSITDETSSPQPDSPQYQESDSQQQFADSSMEEPWYWRWTWTSNCADIGDSISTETGDPKSLDWHWQWQWTWDCDGTGNSTQTTGRNDRSPPSDPSGSTADSSTGQSNPGPPAATATQPDGTWSWTWNFVLCGSEMTVARTAPSGTPLTWDWSWAWSWTCPPAANQDADSASRPADTAAPAGPTVDDAPAPSNAVMTTDAAEPTAGATIAGSTALDPRSIMLFLRGFIPRSRAPAVLGRMPLTLTVAGLPSVVASGAGLVPVDRTSILFSVDIGSTSSAVAPEATRFASPKSPTALPWPDRTAQPGRRPDVSATTTSVPSEAAFHARAQAPRSTPEARPAPRTSSTASSSQKRRGPFAPPLGPQGWLQLAGSVSGVGSSSNLIPFGFATVTGYFVLAPPRLRQRVQPAQELGPRDRHPSPIDNPG